MSVLSIVLRVPYIDPDIAGYIAEQKAAKAAAPARVPAPASSAAAPSAPASTPAWAGTPSSTPANAAKFSTTAPKLCPPGQACEAP